MGLLKEIKNWKPAKLLNDLDVPETIWRPDFDIVDRYQGFAGELMRISLLGIGGVGYLIKELLTDKNGICEQLIKGNKLYVGGGAITLCLSVVPVLFHRFYSTYCLYYLLLIIRSLKRLDNLHWSGEQKVAENEFLTRTRNIQRDKELFSRRLLIDAAICFGAGFIFVVIVFLRILPPTK